MPLSLGGQASKADLVRPPAAVELLPRPPVPAGRGSTRTRPSPPPARGRADSAVSRETSQHVTFPAPPGARILVVANQKGGVGKTTTRGEPGRRAGAGRPARCWSSTWIPRATRQPHWASTTRPGRRAPTRSCSAAMPMTTVVDSPEAPRLTGAAGDHRPGRCRDRAGLHGGPGEPAAAGADQAYLADHPVDYVFLDCPPSLGLLTLNALVAADEILIPIQCEYYALEGVSQLMRTINLVKGELNNELRVSTVLLTMYDARTRLAAQVARRGADPLRRRDPAHGDSPVGADLRGAELRADRADLPPRLRRRGVLPPGRRTRSPTAGA